MAIKRRARATRKPAAKRRRITRIPRALKASGAMNYSRTFWLESWTPNSGGTANFWRYYQAAFSQLPNSTELINLFDRYRINAFKYTFRPRYDSFAGNDTVDTTLPGITNQAGNYAHVIVDRESNLVPTGAYTTAVLNSFLEQGSRVKTYQGIKPFSVYVKKPLVNQEVSGVGGGRRVPSPWLQTAVAASVTHNGFHVFMQDVNLTGITGQTFDVFVTVYMQLKGMR